MMEEPFFVNISFRRFSESADSAQARQIEGANEFRAFRETKVTRRILLTTYAF